VQSTIVPLISIGGAKPDLVLLMVVSWSLLQGTKEGIIWGFTGGLCLDLLSGAPLGASAIALMTVSLLSGQGETNLFKGNLFLPLILAPLGTVIYYGLMLVILELTGQSLPLNTSFTQVILPAAIFNLIMMPFVHSFMRWMHGKMKQQVNW
jgi:rod shape-determining protein MreD